MHKETQRWGQSLVTLGGAWGAGGGFCLLGGCSDLFKKRRGFFFHYKFLLGYIHHMGGFIVTILVRFTMYISYTAPSGEDVFKS